MINGRLSFFLRRRTVDDKMDCRRGRIADGQEKCIKMLFSERIINR